MTPPDVMLSVTFGVANPLDHMRSWPARSLRGGSVAADVSLMIVTQPDGSGSVQSVDPPASCERVIVVEETLRFGEAIDLAVAESSAEYVEFLNPDLELPEG